MIIKRFIGLYLPSHVTAVAYMLQQTHYDIPVFLKWWWRMPDFRRIMYRQTIDKTTNMKQLLLGLRLQYLIFHLSLTVVILVATLLGYSWLVIASAIAFFVFPALFVHVNILPILLAQKFIVQPRQKQTIAKSEQIFQKSPAYKIAVMGSYGKTSMKELLHTVLSNKYKVMSTIGNKNVSISHAIFANKLKQDEEYLILEYGESEPGDIGRFAAITHPDLAIITGFSPNHLDKYKNTQNILDDFKSIEDFVQNNNIYYNSDDSQLSKSFGQDCNSYSAKACGDVRYVSHKIELETGLNLEIAYQKKRYDLTIKLFGKHHIGPILLVIRLALQFGMTMAEITEALNNVQPYEHRMEPKFIGHAWVIDDTYNGNLTGILSGIELLKSVKAKRRIYITPGLVEQGNQKIAVHQQIAQSLWTANFDIIYLINNSATAIINDELKKLNYTGVVEQVNEPLKFYQSIQLITARGDVVLMQNDWADNYY